MLMTIVLKFFIVKSVKKNRNKKNEIDRIA